MMHKTLDWFCAPGSHMTSLNHTLLFRCIEKESGDTQRLLGFADVDAGELKLFTGVFLHRWTMGCLQGTEDLWEQRSLVSRRVHCRSLWGVTESVVRRLDPVWTRVLRQQPVGKQHRRPGGGEWVWSVHGNVQGSGLVLGWTAGQTQRLQTVQKMILMLKSTVQIWGRETRFLCIIGNRERELR